MSDDRRDRLPTRPGLGAALLAAALLGPATSACAPTPPTECVLDRAAVGASIVRRDSPLARLNGWPTAMLVVRNRDGADWRDVEAAIAGVELAAGGGRHATGRYVSAEKKHVARGAAVAFGLGDFANSRGGRWAALTMQATDVDLTLRRGGVSCRAEVIVAGAIE